MTHDWGIDVEASTYAIEYHVHDMMSSETHHHRQLTCWVRAPPMSYDDAVSNSKTSSRSLVTDWTNDAGNAKDAAQSAHDFGSVTDVSADREHLRSPRRQSSVHIACPRPLMMH